MKVTLTDNEVNALRVAARMASASHTELVSMAPSAELRAVFMDLIRHLHSADQKLEGGLRPSVMSSQ